MSDYARKIPNQLTRKGGFPIFTRNNCLQIGMPTTLGYKRGTMYSMGLDDTALNRAKAKTISQQMYLDLQNGTYVRDLSYYLNYGQEENQKSIVTKKETVTVAVAWDTYLEYAKAHLKITTIKYAKMTIYPILSHVLKYRLNDVIGIANVIKDKTTTGTVIRCLCFLQTILKRDFSYLATPTDPYPKVIREFKGRLPKVINISTAKAIPVDEFNYALELIGNKKGNYELFLEFMWLTGCRPSEATGVSWSDIEDEYIILGDSMARYQGNWHKVKGSKNNKLRKFPIGKELTELIKKTPKVDNPWNLLYTTVRGKPIDLSNFSTHVFSQVLPDYTLYNIRDTFITRQVENHTPLAIIGQWCDNSEEIIQERYLAKTKVHTPT